MNLLIAIVLGLVQGLTEFIPISSTAHLTIFGEIFGTIDHNHPEQWTAFIAIIQLGTLASVMWYFRREIYEIPIAFIRENLGKKRTSISKQSLNSKLGWFVIVGSLPIMTIGLALKKLIEGDFTKNLTVIAISLIVLAILLLIAEKTARLKKEEEQLNFWDALWVGVAQCIALIPGSSRSGTTITAGLLLGMKRETAARFSFLLSIPAIFASGLLQFYQALSYVSPQDWINIVVATIVSGVSGYFAIDFLIKYLKKHSTYIFIIYRIIAGIAILILVYAR